MHHWSPVRLRYQEMRGVTRIRVGWSGHGGGGDRVLWVLDVPVPTAELTTACMRAPGGWMGGVNEGISSAIPSPPQGLYPQHAYWVLLICGSLLRQNTLPSNRVGARILWCAELSSTSNSSPETEPLEPTGQKLRDGSWLKCSGQITNLNVPVASHDIESFI